MMAGAATTACAFALVDTALGWIALAATERGLRHVVLPLPTAAEAEKALRRACAGALPAAGLPGDVPDRLRRYALGELIRFPDPVDLAGASPFQQRVWGLTRTIPWGQTRSYGWLAVQAGNPRGARAVGRALACNPVPIVVPCHRVIGSQGQLCGFGGGVALKARLLGIEGEGQFVATSPALPEAAGRGCSPGSTAPG